MAYLEVRDLKKRYGALEAVKGVSFSVEKQAFFAFLGPNGAGKSTTINILSTLLSRDEGEVILNGHRLGQDDDLIRQNIGIVFQTNMLDDRLSIRENLQIRGRFYGLSSHELKRRIDRLESELSMGNFIHQKYGQCSGGQRRRADIARALINEPNLLILDEPTTGLDPKTREEVWAYIETLRKKNMTLFLTTHYMEEAAQASQVAVIHEGNIIAQGSPSALKQAYSQDVLKLTGKKTVIRPYLKKQGMPYTEKNGQFIIPVSSIEALPILNALKDDLEYYEVIQGSMDDVFLNLTGRDLTE
jgi:multidrug/hemolysin transport system ATP-binding protein